MNATPVLSFDDSSEFSLYLCRGRAYRFVFTPVIQKVMEVFNPEAVGTLQTCHTLAKPPTAEWIASCVIHMRPNAYSTFLRVFFCCRGLAPQSYNVAPTR